MRDIITIIGFLLALILMVVLLLIAPQSASETLPQPTPTPEASPDLSTVDERFTIEASPLPTRAPSPSPREMADVATATTAPETCMVHEPEPVVVRVFDDFLCPYCEREYREAWFPLYQQEFFADQGVEVRFHALPIHGERSAELAKAAICAQAVDDPWVFRQWLYDSEEKTLEKAIAIATKLGADAEVYAACLQAEETRSALEADIELAQELGVTGTPALVIDDFTTIGLLPQENIAYEIRKAVAKKGEKPLSCGG